MFEFSEPLIPWQHLHPILVNFTAALVPASVGSDLLGKFTKTESLKSAAWWMLFYATLVTPLTVAAGWFWKNDLPPAALREDLIITHQWLGTSLVMIFLLLAIWRGSMFYQGKEPRFYYFIFAVAVVAALAYQGSLGGEMVFG